MASLPELDDRTPGSGQALVLFAFALGPALRLRGFGDAWINPDEGIYFELALTPGWASFWQGVASNPHPPLRAATALPRLDIPDRDAGLLVLGGWNLDRLHRPDARDELAGVGPWRASPGLRWARVDWPRYRRALVTSSADE